MKHLTSNFVQLCAVLLIIFSGLSAPLLVLGKAAAVNPVPVCQDATSSPSSTLGAPTLLTPSNNGTNPNGFDFSWTSVSAAVQYDWESSLTPDLNPDSSFVNRLGYHRLAPTSINEGNSPAMTYYWHVRAVASDGSTSAWSQTWKVTISNAQTSYLSAPVLALPSDGATCNIYAQDFDFTWNAPVSDGGQGPLTYIWQSGRSAATDPASGEFTDQPLTNTNVMSTSISDGNSSDGTYYWHVRAVASNGTLGPWSATWAVTITHDAPIESPVGTPPTTPPTVIPEGTPSVTLVTTPVIPTISTVSTSVQSFFIPPSADIAVVLGANTKPTKASKNKTPTKKANLTANISTASGNLFTRNLIWIVALVLALSGGVFAYHRSSTNSK